MDFYKYQYASKRRVVFGHHGMVCTTQPLAAQAGLDIMKKGGNAIDAAIATAICMTVLEPTSNGIGSDSFALVWTKDKLHGLNASGHAPMKASVETIKNMGHTEVPNYGFIPVTVNGAPSAWKELSKTFGKLPFNELFEAAIDYAENGFPVQPNTSYLWDKAFNTYKENLSGNEFENWFKTFAPNGRAPRPGEIFKLPNHALTLRELADTGCESYYRGAIAEKIDSFSKAYGGLIRKEDYASYYPEWVEPISTSYRGYDVWEIPPNGHGLVALMALNIVEGFNFDANSYGSVDTLHKQIEAMKLAFVDGQHYIADPHFMKVSVEKLLSKKYADSRRQTICDTALTPKKGDPDCGGTIYLCTADEEGNMVSYIQSNYRGFGSGLVVPGTGIALHNRGNNFSLIEGTENCIEPGKKPYHTIIPGFLSKSGKAIGPFGVMGGFMQPQGHLQVVTNTIDFNMNPQEALDAPRWQWVGGKNIQVEREFPYAVTEELIRKGHNISVLPESTTFGRGNIIWRDENGTLIGATEPRADGYVSAW